MNINASKSILEKWTEFIEILRPLWLRCGWIEVLMSFPSSFNDFHHALILGSTDIFYSRSSYRFSRLICCLSNGEHINIPLGSILQHHDIHHSLITHAYHSLNYSSDASMCSPQRFLSQLVFLYLHIQVSDMVHQFIATLVFNSNY